MVLRIVSLVGCVLLALLTIATDLRGQQQVREAEGIVRGTVARSLMLRVPDQQGHLLGLVETQGTNESTGTQPFLHAASVRIVETWDFVVGSGSDRGFIIFTAGADTLVARYEGTAAEKAGGGTEIRGRFTFLRGVGELFGISGDGSYEGLASPQGFDFRWRAAIRQ